MTEERVARCYEIQRSRDDPALYRAHDLANGRRSEFRVTEERAVATGPPGEVGGEGGAAAPSAAELAAELSNPVSLNVAPVVKNGLAGWFGLGRD